MPTKPTKPPKRRPRISRAAAAKATERIQRTRFVEVELTMQHSINGQSYGPGRVKMRADTAQCLLENEQRVRDTEQVFQAKDRAFVVGARLRPVPVPSEMFDIALGNALPFATFSGR